MFRAAMPIHRLIGLLARKRSASNAPLCLRASVVNHLFSPRRRGGVLDVPRGNANPSFDWFACKKAQFVECASVSPCFRGESFIFTTEARRRARCPARQCQSIV